MKPSSVLSLTLAAAAALATDVQAHGQMTKPEPRPVSALFRANAGALKNAGDSELQWAPLENLSQRKQADFPEAATFDIMNGCRGMIYESGNTVTTLAAGEEFTVTYYIQAPHPGYMNLNIVKPKASTTGGAIMHEKYLSVLTVDDFASSGGTFDLTATMPSTVSGCTKAGDCALQFYWHSDVANQTYPTCADIIVGGSGTGSATTEISVDGTDATASASASASSDTASASSTAASTGTDANSAASGEDAATEAPETGSSSTSSSASAASETTATPAPTTATPASTSKKCTRRLRLKN